MLSWVLPMVLALAPATETATATRPGAAPTAERGLHEATAARFAELALACVHREYPNKIAHALRGDEDVKPPRELTPAFYGCYDWHSAVHGHWLLARLARTFPTAPFAARAREALAASLTPEHIAVEVAYLNTKGRETFERPYGLAWLLQLAAELREWDDPQTPQASRWSHAITPLAQAAAARLRSWLPKLTHPVRIGEHGQTAFSLGLALDWARGAGDSETASVIASRARFLFLGDRRCPLDYEPSGEDFLSPCLAEADLVRRLLPPAEFAAWLGAFLPQVPGTSPGALPAGAAGADAAPWLVPGEVTDPSDGKLVHLHGLNLSRAWMLEGIASALPPADPRLPTLRAAAALHRERGLAGVSGEHYEAGHWLGSFAVYLTTARGLSAAPREPAP